MAAFTDEEVAELQLIATRTANAIVNRHGGSAEDLAQSIWVWLLESGRRDWLQYKDDGNKALFTRKVQFAARKISIAEARKNLGYDWRDDYVYSRREVARLLPLALDEEGIPGLSAGALHDGPSSKSDPAYGGGLLASIMDVRIAYGKLSTSDQAFIATVIECDSDWSQVSEETGLTPGSAQTKYARCIERMITRYLGRRDDAA